MSQKCNTINCCDKINKMPREKTKKITNARAINKMRCIVGLVICSIVIILTVVSLTLNFINFYNEESPEAGIGTLRMYTTLSNILAALAASICIPFQIEGLRKNRFKLPVWVVEVMFVGTCGVFLTFLIALTTISPAAGFVYTMFEKSNLFMHTLNPIFITLLFTVAISDAKIKFNRTFYTIIPTFIYSLIYFICAFVANVWRDHYHIQDFIPWPVAFIAIMAIAFGIAVLLRFLHNLTNGCVQKGIEKYYIESPDYEFEKITFAIAKLAKEESKYYSEGDEIYIPVDIIELLSKRYKTATLPLDIQYDIYLESYLSNIHIKESETDSKKVKE